MQQRRATAVVLAAGIGKRFKSEVPKVLHDLVGKPLVGHVVALLNELDLERIVIVTSSDVDPLRDALSTLAPHAA